MPVWDKQWWKEFFFEIRWYLFLERYPKKYIGHNPVGQIAMASFCGSPCSCASPALPCTAKAPAPAVGRTAPWLVIGAFGSSLDVHNWHRLAMWALCCL